MAISNIHEEIGWFNCANLNCKAELGRDHVTLITTAHARRFCSVECIAEGLAAWHRRIYREAAEMNAPVIEALRTGRRVDGLRKIGFTLAQEETP